MEFFDAGLWAASAACALGAAWRAASWRRGRGGRPASPAARWRPGAGLAALGAEALLLGRTWRTGRLRWLGHCLIFFGFMGLLLFHAMDDQITVRLVAGDYAPPMDPWQWLRDLGGAMVLAGAAIMLARRLAVRGLLRVTRLQDWAALALVGGIALSGVALEAAKIISPAVFDRMVEDYFFPDEEGDVAALKAHWAHENGVAFTEPPPADPETLARGAELNDGTCASCHSPTASAFAARPVADALRAAGLAPALNRLRADVGLWYVHVALCFLALAALPWAKFAHPVLAPVNLFLRARRRDAGGASPHGLGPDACTRCGECSLHCSVAPIHTVMGNADILPSEKLASLKGFWSPRGLKGEGLAAFAEGSRICTECLRCTDVCSAGINLQELWMASKPQAAAQAPDPNAALNAMSAAERMEALDGAPLPEGALARDMASFWACVQCTTCTSVCPVVAVCEDPTRDLDLAPQQIMNLLRMGLPDRAMGVRMVWSCTTCYKCQEHCPQNIRVADILYELRQAAAARLRHGGR